MFRSLKNAVKNWWVFLIIGVISLVCGIIILCAPEIGFSSMSIILTVDLISAGVLGIVFVVTNRDLIPAWGWNLVLPVLIVIFGLITAGTFGGSEALLISFFAVGVLFKGIETVIFAASIAGIKGSGWGWTLAGGILVITFGGYLLANPYMDVLVIGYAVAFAMIFIGIDAISVSVQLSRAKSFIKAVEKAMIQAKEAAEKIQKTEQ